MPVYRTQRLEQRQIGGQRTCGAVANFFDGEAQLAARSALSRRRSRIPMIHCVFGGAMQRDLEPQNLVDAGGSEVDGGFGAFGYRVDAGSAMDGAEIQC